MSNIIEVEDLYFNYRDGTEALRGLSLYVKDGERVALLGPNGAGKSTLLLHLNGINIPQRGAVRVLGREVNSRSEKWVRTKVGLVFQDPDDQVFSYTVREDVAFGPTNMGLGPAEAARRVEAALEAVGMSEYGDRPPYHLSYGQKKRVAIAGILAMQPPVIVLDEPLAYLDPRGKETLLEILNRLYRDGVTIIIATHDVDFAAEWADRVIIIKNGRTLCQGDTSLLTEGEVIREAHLRFPVVTQIFQKLGWTGPDKLPSTVDGAVAVIRKLISSKEK